MTAFLAILGAGTILLVVILLMRRRGEENRGDLVRPPPGLGRHTRPTAPSTPASGTSSYTPIGEVPAAVAAEARRLMAQNQKLEAVKLVRSATKWDLGEAKDWVERL
jgi:hypothetical protein